MTVLLCNMLPLNTFYDCNFFLFRHIPKAKATTVAETPELKRIAENTKIQSNVSGCNFL